MLNVTAKLTLGRMLYDSHLVSARLRRGLLPVVDRLEVTLPRGVSLDAQPGDDAKLELDGGEGATNVFSGMITSIRRGLDGVSVVGHGGGQALARTRPVAGLQRLSVGQVIRRLCEDAAVDTAAIEDGPTLALYVADGRAPALDEIARLADLLGGRALFDGDNRLHVVAGDDSGPAEDLALRFGREVLALELQEGLSDGASRTEVGEGAGDASSSRGRWPIADFFQGSGAAPGPAARRRARPELRTVDDSRSASSAWTLRQAQAERPLRLRTFLLPALVPGARLEVQDLPDDLPSVAGRVRQLVHVLDVEAGAHTEIWAQAEGGGAGGGLLGAIAGAVGGLL